MNWIITYHNYKLSKYNLKPKSIPLTDLSDNKLKPIKGKNDPPVLDLSEPTIQTPKPPKTPCVRCRPKKKIKKSMNLYVIPE